MKMTRREMMKIVAGALPAMGAVATGCATRMTSVEPNERIRSGPFQPNWQSLTSQYKCHDWFRDAKFGIWAHWSAQCVPEQGDWYARQMYIQGQGHYNFHVKTYGHPSKFGFMELDNLWKADKWEPEKLMALYKRAGAKYFMSLANHHDNFDAYDSKYHAWNSVNVGPKKDIVGTWAKLARANGLRFGVSNHSGHSWHWLQTAYGYDGEGSMAGVRYDAYTLTKEDGKGKWWEGLDPQELYCGRNIVMPDGLKSAREVSTWHERNTRPWSERAPEMNPKFTETWYLRCRDLVDKYQPDMLYFDDIGQLPLGQAGLDIAAHFYNSNLHANHGKIQAVLNVKGIDAARRAGIVEDYERGASTDIQPAPWQTDTCIGEWHYNRSIFNRHGYKTVASVVRSLVNIVSKNGNLLLSIPLRGDGTIDADEVAFLEGLAKWMDVNGEGIFATRPWKVFGEGPARSGGGMFSEGRTNYTAQDIRFTQKGDTLYAFLLAWPSDPRAVIKSLGTNAKLLEKPIKEITMLGSKQKLKWSQTGEALTIDIPNDQTKDVTAAFKIRV
jgi:alpha-L-fucosidase